MFKLLYSWSNQSKVTTKALICGEKSYILRHRQVPGKGKIKYGLFLKVFFFFSFLLFMAKKLQLLKVAVKNEVSFAFELLAQQEMI